MSSYADNLGRAARLLKRVADIGGPNEFEGVAISEIVGDVLTAQSRAYMGDALKTAQNSTRDLNDIEKTHVAMLRKRYERSARKPW